MNSVTQTHSPTLQLACELIRRRSITPQDDGCQQLIGDRLKKIGFSITHLPFGEVQNLWAIRGSEGPLFVFAGHTDVVPAGDEQEWRYLPFAPMVDNGMLYGRGAADMKGSLAAMVVACEEFVADYPDHSGRIAFLITSDEEGDAVNGTAKVMQWLQAQNEEITWCVVGEPSSTKVAGDAIKNGRRGSLGGVLTVKGKQGHVAYPHLAENPIHTIAPAIVDLTAEQWDQGNGHFPATSFQISNFNSGTGATNVIPGSAKLIFNFRFSTEVNAEQLKSRTEAILKKHQVDYSLSWNLSGKPFLTAKGELVEAAIASIRHQTGINASLSTAGGTSDGRFIAPTGAQVVELGPINATIHQLDECVAVSDLENLRMIHHNLLERLLVQKST